MFIIGRLNSNEYFIKTKRCYIDDEICDILGLNLEQYQNILKEFNGTQHYMFDDITFKNKTDAEKAINALEPYLIMKKLKGE